MSITLVPVFSMVIDILIGGQLIDHFESNNLFCKSQFGFRKGLSTYHALVALVDDILSCFEDKAFAAVTFCDLSKAFDCVSHKLIISKLRHYNVNELALDVFKSYLENRVQYVSCGGETSEKLPVTCGVPQGSILGPLLFLVMINDLSECVPANIVLYADDTTVISKHNTSSHALNLSKTNLKYVQNWLTANELVLNETKLAQFFLVLKLTPFLLMSFQNF